MKKEFFNHNDELYCTSASGTVLLSKNNRELILEILSKLKIDYPIAYTALSAWHETKIDRNTQQWKMVSQFIKCNLSNLDNLADITEEGVFQFEDVYCPARQTCPYNGIVCRPTFFTSLTSSEKKVLALSANNLPVKTIADNLCLSINTIKTHQSHGLKKLGLKTVKDLIVFNHKHKIFD